MENLHFGLRPNFPPSKSMKTWRNPLPKLKIREGSPIEVCSKEDGFMGSYYEAKVISRIHSDKFMVEYRTLVTDNHKQQLLREIVEDEEVRPVPPVIRVHGFELMQKVDAFDNDGWWVGLITGQSEEHKYSVYFDLYGVEIVYPVQKLRVHQEWQDGNWVVF